MQVRCAAEGACVCVRVSVLQCASSSGALQRECQVFLLCWPEPVCSGCACCPPACCAGALHAPHPVNDDSQAGVQPCAVSLSPDACCHGSSISNFGLQPTGFRSRCVIQGCIHVLVPSEGGSGQAYPVRAAGPVGAGWVRCCGCDRDCLAHTLVCRCCCILLISLCFVLAFALI